MVLYLKMGCDLSRCVVAYYNDPFVFRRDSIELDQQYHSEDQPIELINHHRSLTGLDQKDESDKAECDQNQITQLQHELGSETESRLSDSRPHLDSGSPIREVTDELDDLKSRG